MLETSKGFVLVFFGKTGRKFEKWVDWMTEKRGK